MENYPLNRGIFDEWMFAPSKTTDNAPHVTANNSINLDQFDINWIISIEPENNEETNNIILIPEFEPNSETLERQVVKRPPEIQIFLVRMETRTYPQILNYY